MLRRANSGGTPPPLFMYRYFRDTILMAAGERRFTPAEGVKILAARAPRPDLAPNPTFSTGGWFQVF
jgi:hypothetical protein